MVEVMALQTDMLFEAVLDDARLTRCIRVWLGLGPVQHSQSVGGQFMHVLAEFLTDTKLDTLEQPDSRVGLVPV